MALPVELFAREAAPALDAVLGKTLPVLDDGFVRVIDYMGTDGAIVQAARVSYGAGTKKRSADRALIRYLLRHRHTTPLEMCSLKLHVRVPMDCWRQWIRHRTASVNEYSTRYSLAIDAVQATPSDAWRRQSTDNRQGSGERFAAEVGERLSSEEAELQAHGRVVYAERIELGVAREQARKDLPLSTYTEAYWKIDLHNLLHFLALRMDPAAQAEIRAYAEVIGNEIVRRWVPIAWEAFCDYRMQAIELSRQEIELTGLMLRGDHRQLRQRLCAWAWLTRAPATDAAQSNALWKPSRELVEWRAKLSGMGVAWDWTALPLDDSPVDPSPPSPAAHA